MTLFELILLSIALAADATVVAIACGACFKGKKRVLVKTAFTFAIFQALMPILGFILGAKLSFLIQTFGNILAFFLLLLVGVKTILESKEEEKCDVLDNGRLFALAVATSIDAFVVGVTFSLIETQLYFNVFIIGLTTLVLALLGGVIGRRVNAFSIRAIRILSGLVIILIGVKTLIS